MDKEIIDACKLVARHYEGKRGIFAYRAFEHINATFFDDALPWPLIVWALTPHGRSQAEVRVGKAPPKIVLHPSSLRGTEKPNPWEVDPSWLGWCFAYDLLLHECMHVKVVYLGNGRRGRTPHDCAQWVAEINRIAPLLGLGDIRAEVSKVKRVPIEGQTTKTGKPATKVKRVNGGNVPSAALAGFPHSVRALLGATDFYTRNVLPFEWE